MKKFNIFIATLIFAASTFYANFYLSIKLDVESYGVFSLVYAFVNLLIPVVLFGQPTALTFIYFSEEKSGNRNIDHEVKKSLDIIYAIFLLVVLIVVSGKYLFNIKEYSIDFVALFLLAIFSQALRMQYVNLFLLYEWSNIYLISSFVVLSSTVVVLLLSPSIYGYFISLVSAVICIKLIDLFLGNLKTTSVESCGSFQYIDLVKLGWYAIPSMTIANIHTYVDRFIINTYLDIDKVAYYSMAALISVGVGSVIITGILRSDIIQILESLQKKDIERYGVIQKNNIFVLVALLIISFILINVFASDFMWLFLGEKYQESIQYLFPLFASSMLLGLTQMYSQPLIQEGKLNVLLNIAIVSVISNIGLSISLVQFIQVKGIVWALLVSNLVSFFLVFYLIKKRYITVKFPTVFFMFLFLFVILNEYLH